MAGCRVEDRGSNETGRARLIGHDEGIHEYRELGAPEAHQGESDLVDLSGESQHGQIARFVNQLAVSREEPLPHPT